MHHSAVPITRRRLLAAAGAALGTAAVPRAAGAWPGGGDGGWPTAAHDLAGTRATPVNVRRGPGVRWRAHAAGGVPGAAAVAGGTVVVASLGGEVVALDRLAGAERWRVALAPAVYDGVAMGFFAGPAIADGRVLVASDRVTALDLRTGRTRWTAPPLGADDYFWGPPTVVGPLVLVGSGSGSETPRSRGRLSAYDLRSGRLRWSTATVPEGANGGGVIAPATVDLRRGRVYVTTGAPYAAVDGPNPARRACWSCASATAPSRGPTRSTRTTRAGWISTAPPCCSGRARSRRPRTGSTPGTACGARASGTPG